MERSAKAEGRLAEYLNLLKIMYGTCLTGFSRAKGLLDVSFLGMLITQGALLGAIYFIEDLDDSAIVAIVVIVVLATLWWFRTINKELAKHEEVKLLHEENEKLLTKASSASIAISQAKSFAVRLRQMKFNKSLVPCSRNTASKPA